MSLNPNFVELREPPSAIHDDIIADRRRRNVILVAVCLALMAVIASVSGLNVAQPQLAAELSASQGQLLWIINGYTLALAALLLPLGALGDRRGRRLMLVSGLGLFVVASVASALAGSTELLMLSRIVAGVSAAMIMPATLSIITSTFPADAKGKAIGVWAGIAGVSGIAGMISSAMVVDAVGWRWVFAGPLAVAVAAIVLVLAVVPESREVTEHRFDLFGSMLSALSVGGLVYAVHEGPEQGWTSTITLAAFVVGALAAVTFVWWERRHVSPLLDVRVFADRSVSSASVGITVLFAVMFGMFLVVVQFLQIILGWSALRSTLALLPIIAVMMPLSVLAPTLTQRLGFRRMLVGGAALVAAGLAYVATVAADDVTYLQLLPGLIVVAAGMGLSMTPSTAAITESLPADKQGVASALNDTVREAGAALGVALLGSVLQAGYSGSVARATAGLPAGIAGHVEEGIGSAVAVVPSLGEQGAVVLQAARHAFVDGWSVAMWMACALAVGAALFVAVFGPRRAVADIDAAPDASTNSTAQRADLVALSAIDY